MAEIEKLQRVCQQLQQKLDQFDEHAKGLQDAQSMSDEKARQQDELLDRTMQRADNADRENHKLNRELNAIRAWTDRLDDIQVKVMVHKLYHEVETWIQIHFWHICSGDLSVKSDHSSELSSADSALPLDFSYIHSELMRLIFHSILSRFMVGIGERALNTFLYHIDQEIQSLCKYDDSA